jgi:hypothetical protein
MITYHWCIRHWRVAQERMVDGTVTTKLPIEATHMLELRAEIARLAKLSDEAFVITSLTRM